ncbi:hypothetical protein ACFLUJ_05890 [Chloroflexota bacterium]
MNRGNINKKWWKTALIIVGVLSVILVATNCSQPTAETPPLEPTSPVTPSPPPSASTVPDPATLELSQVKVAALYENVTLGGGSNIEAIIDMLRETKTDYVRGFFKSGPTPMECQQYQQLSGFQPSTMNICEAGGSSWGILQRAISEIKRELPNMLFCGAIVPTELGRMPGGTENVQKVEFNPKTGEVIEGADLWEMAADPGKWGINVSKEQFQYDEAQAKHWIPTDLDFELYDWQKAQAIFPDITNAHYQELFLSWAQQMIDCGVDVIWFDVPFWQVRLLTKTKIIEDDHPAVKEICEAVSKIVDEIREYGQREGKRIYVGSWPASLHLEADFPTPDWDFITMSPWSSEVEEMKLDQARWDQELTAVRKRYGDVPILVHIDWAQLPIFSQKFNIEEQREFLKIADDFFYRNGVIFIYPIRGGWLTTNATKLSYGKSPIYDSKAPEFQTYDTIKQLALSKRQR